jgi:hypothetical protein
VEDMIRRFHSALPQIRACIDQCLESNAATARRLDSLPPLRTAFPPEVLARARMVLVSQTPFPPVSQFGLLELGDHERRAFDGITFKNTFFVVDAAKLCGFSFMSSCTRFSGRGLAWIGSFWRTDSGFSRMATSRVRWKRWHTALSSNSLADHCPRTWSGSSRMGRTPSGIRSRQLSECRLLRLTRRRACWNASIRSSAQSKCELTWRAPQSSSIWALGSASLFTVKLVRVPTDVERLCALRSNKKYPWQ